MLYKITVPTDTNTLDPDIAALCDEAAIWLTLARFSAQALGLTLAMGIVSMLPRIHTGYMTKAARTAKAACDYSHGFKFAPARETADEKALAHARKWGLA